MTLRSNETSPPAKNPERCRRPVLAAWVALALALCSHASAQPGKDKPEKFSRTPQQVAHERFVVGGMTARLATYLELARRHGRFVQLDATVRDAAMILGATRGTDPYPRDELEHLEQASRQLDAYLAVSPRTQDGLSPKYPLVRKAIEKLALVRKSLANDKGGSR